MPSDYRYLSETDVERIQDIADRLRTLENRQRWGGANEEQEDQWQTPEVLLCKTPADGLPAMTGASPGSARCDIYKLIPQGNGRQLVAAGFQETVYNVSPVALGPNTLLKIERDRFGDWTTSQAASVFTYVTLLWGQPDPQIGNSIEVPGSLVDQDGNPSTSDFTDIYITVSDLPLDSSPSQVASISQAQTPLGRIIEGEGTASIRIRPNQGQFRITVTSTNSCHYLWGDQSKNSQEFVKMMSDVLPVCFVPNDEETPDTVGGFIKVSVTAWSDDTPPTGAANGTGHILSVGTANAVTTENAWYCVSGVSNGSIDLEIIGPGGSGSNVGAGGGGAWTRWSGVPIISGMTWDYGFSGTALEDDAVVHGTYFKGPWRAGATYAIYQSLAGIGYLVQSPRPATVQWIYYSEGGENGFDTGAGETTGLTTRDFRDENGKPLKTKGLPGTNYYYVFTYPTGYTNQTAFAGGAGGHGGNGPGPISPGQLASSMTSYLGGGGGSSASAAGKGHDGGNAIVVPWIPNSGVPYLSLMAKGGVPPIGGGSGGDADTPFAPIDFATVTIAADSDGGIVGVTDIPHGGSGYPPNTSIALLVDRPNGLSNGIINVSTDSAGTVTTFNSVVQAGGNAPGVGNIGGYFSSSTRATMYKASQGGTGGYYPGGGGSGASHIGGVFVSYPISFYGGSTVGGQGQIKVNGLVLPTINSGGASNPTGAESGTCMLLSPLQVTDYQNQGYTVNGPFSSEVSCNSSCQSQLPYIISLNPHIGPVAGGTDVTITGGNFTGTSAVYFGNMSATDFTVDSNTEIIATSPAHAIGTIEVTVTSGIGTSVQTTGGLFTYYDPNPPEVTFINPNNGTILGGTIVTITGNYFVGTTSVKFGTTEATSFSVKASTQIVAVSPPHPYNPVTETGLVDVTVTTPSGTSATNLFDQFQYRSNPTIFYVIPSYGTTAGGEDVAIGGQGFSGIYKVTVDGIEVAYVFSGDGSIHITTLAHAAGIVDIRIYTNYGVSYITNSDKFTFIAAGPTVTSLSPTSGCSTGGNTVTITGTGFTGATSVQFGTLLASFTIDSNTQIKAIAPAYEDIPSLINGSVSSGPGVLPVDVTVTNGSVSAISSADKYTYKVFPIILLAGPTYPSVLGGEAGEIIGVGFTGATAVKYGATDATSFVVVDSTRITTVTPAHAAGEVTLSVVAPCGTSDPAINENDKTTFVSAPAVTGVSPNFGPTGGGTFVTITGTNLISIPPLSNPIKFDTTLISGYISGTPTQLVVISPAHAAGQVDITVTTEAGTSAIVTADEFTFSSMLLYDTFQDTTNTQLSAHTMNIGPGWTVNARIGIAGNLRIVSNQATIAVAADTWIQAVSDAGSANHTTAIKFSIASTGGIVSVICRYQDANNYIRALVGVDANLLRILKVVAGFQSIVDTQTIGTLNPGIAYELKFVTTSTTLNATLSGSDIVTVTSGNISDSTGATNTQFGFDLLRFDAGGTHQIYIISFVTY